MFVHVLAVPAARRGSLGRFVMRRAFRAVDKGEGSKSKSKREQGSGGRIQYSTPRDLKLVERVQKAEAAAATKTHTHATYLAKRREQEATLGVDFSQNSRPPVG